jgi:hypothetical protein
MLRCFYQQQKRLITTVHLQPKHIKNVRLKELANQAFYSLHRPLLGFSQVVYKEESGWFILNVDCQSEITLFY